MFRSRKKWPSNKYAVAGLRPGTRQPQVATAFSGSFFGTGPRSGSIRSGKDANGRVCVVDEASAIRAGEEWSGSLGAAEEASGPRRPAFVEDEDIGIDGGKNERGLLRAEDGGDAGYDGEEEIWEASMKSERSPRPCESVTKKKSLAGSSVHLPGRVWGK
jgi:hypothetical protein